METRLKQQEILREAVIKQKLNAFALGYDDTKMTNEKAFNAIERNIMEMEE